MDKREFRALPMSDQLLILIEEHSTPYDGAYWVPPGGTKEHSIRRVPGASVFVDGGGVGSALRSLERRRLIERPDGAPDSVKYAYRITEDGVLRTSTLL